MPLIWNIHFGKGVDKDVLIMIFLLLLDHGLLRELRIMLSNGRITDICRHTDQIGQIDMGSRVPCFCVHCLCTDMRYGMRYFVKSYL